MFFVITQFEFLSTSNNYLCSSCIAQKYCSIKNSKSQHLCKLDDLSVTIHTTRIKKEITQN